jgi:hypothetical protein
MQYVYDSIEFCLGTTIVALRKGEDAKVSTFSMVAKALRVPLSYFFEEDAI